VVIGRTAYLPPDFIKKYDITVTPLRLIWGEEAFCDGVVILP
jgi:fatty acid-binding protein DegV